MIATSSLLLTKYRQANAISTTIGSVGVAKSNGNQVFNFKGFNCFRVEFKNKL